MPFDAVDEDHAYAEGEDDRTLAVVARRARAPTGAASSAPAVGPDLRVVLERFELLYPRASDR